MSSRGDLLELLDRGHIAHDHVERAVELSGVRPSRSDWRNFVDQLLLWLSAIALVCSVLFFVAYNWTELGRFAKFALVEVLLAIAIGAYLKLEASQFTAQVALFAGAVLTGVLLALFGQTYQTGADPWQLFFVWALFILPLVIIARFPALWLLWLGLLNTALILYFEVFGGWIGAVLSPLFGSDFELQLLIFILNAVALAVWEFAAPNREWLNVRWAPRALAVASGVAITWIGLMGVLDSDIAPMFALSMWIGWLAILYFFYCHRRPDLFMLAGGSLSAIVVIVAFFAKHLLTDLHSGGFLLLALIVIGLGGGAAFWLNYQHRRWQA